MATGLMLLAAAAYHAVFLSRQKDWKFLGPDELASCEQPTFEIALVIQRILPAHSLLCSLCNSWGGGGMSTAGAIALGHETIETVLSRTREQARAAASVDWQLISSRAEFERLEPEWNALHARVSGASKVFLNFNWNWHWANHYLSDQTCQLAIVVGRRHGVLVSIWPLVSQRLAGLRMVTFMGMPVSQYGDLLVDRTDPQHETMLRQGWTFVRTSLKADLVLLRKVREDSAVAALMRQLGVSGDNQQSAPYIDLRGVTSYQSFEETYNGRDRRNRRRRRRRLEEIGTVAGRRLSEPEVRQEGIELAMLRKREWLTTQGRVSTAVADPRFEAFFRDAVTSTQRPCACDISELTIDGHPVATKITVNDGNYCGLHFSSYDQAMDKFSPGALVLEYTIAGAIEQGSSTFDFMAPAAPYKLEWTDKQVSIADYAVPIGLLGTLYQSVYLRQLRPHLQRLAKEGPAPVRRLIGGALKLLNRHSAAPVGVE